LTEELELICEEDISDIDISRSGMEQQRPQR